MITLPRPTENPWQTLSTHTAYDNPWIRLDESQVRNPSGGPGIYGVVHFKNYAVGVVPLDDELNTWLVGQYRYTLGVYSWEIPEGGGKRDQDPLLSAQRELKEETGLVAEHWEFILEMHLSNSVSDERALLYVARGLRQEAAEPEATEDLRVVKLPFEEAYRLTMAGEITDAMSVAAILKVKHLLAEGKL